MDVALWSTLCPFLIPSLSGMSAAEWALTSRDRAAFRSVPPTRPAVLVDAIVVTSAAERMEQDMNTMELVAATLHVAAGGVGVVAAVVRLLAAVNEIKRPSVDRDIHPHAVPSAGSPAG